jgi:hypothetical protein
MPPAGEASQQNRYGPSVEIDGSPELRFTKVQGVAAGAGLGVVFKGLKDLHLGGALRRSLERGAWEGYGVVGVFTAGAGRTRLPTSPGLRVTGGGASSPGSPPAGPPGYLREKGWGVVLGWSDQPTPFGSNRVHGTTLAGGLGGLDHQSYLQRRERAAALLLHPARAIHGDVAFVQREDRPLKPVADGLLDLDEDVMGSNPRADRANLHGITTAVSLGDAGDDPKAESGVWLRAGFWGGALKGEREFYTAGAEARREWTLPPRSKLETEVRLGFAGGDPPIQDMPDLGGEGSLRAYPPRAFSGPAACLLRVDYLLGVDLFRAARVPVLKGLKLQPVISFDAGAVWGDAPWDGADALAFPDARDWRFDAGAGLQKYIGFPPFLSAVRLEAAFRLDRERDRLRVNFLLIP